MSCLLEEFVVVCVVNVVVIAVVVVVGVANFSKAASEMGVC